MTTIKVLALRRTMAALLVSGAPATAMSQAARACNDKMTRYKGNANPSCNW